MRAARSLRPSAYDQNTYRNAFTRKSCQVGVKCEESHGAKWHRMSGEAPRASRGRCGRECTGVGAPGCWKGKTAFLRNGRTASRKVDDIEEGIEKGGERALALRCHAARRVPDPVDQKGRTNMRGVRAERSNDRSCASAKSDAGRANESAASSASESLRANQHSEAAGHPLRALRLCGFD